MNQKQLESQTSQSLYFKTPSHKWTFWDYVKQWLLVGGEFVFWVIFAILIFGLTNGMMG